MWYLDDNATATISLLLVTVLTGTLLLVLPRRDHAQQYFWMITCLLLASVEAFTDHVVLPHAALDILTATAGAIVAFVLARRAQRNLGQSKPLWMTILLCSAPMMFIPVMKLAGADLGEHNALGAILLVAASCWPMLDRGLFRCLREHWDSALLFALILSYAVITLTPGFDEFDRLSVPYVMEAISHFLGVVIGFIASTVALRQTLRANERLAASERVARLAQEESSRFLSALIDTAPAGVYVKDLDGRYTLTNSVFKSWIDTPQTPTVGSADCELYDADVVEEVKDLDALVKATRKPQHREMPLRRKGEPIGRIVENHKFPLLDERGEVTAIAGLLVDVTQAKEHERELVAARLKAEEASRAKSNFLAHMSHELRTPLNAIIGFSDVIHRGLFGPDNIALYQQYAGDIHRAGNLLLSQVNDLLDISRVEAGTFDLSLKSIALGTIAEECCHLLRDQAERRNVTLAVDADRPLPQVVCDRRATLQVLINLAGNAIKYVPEGSAITIAGGRTESGVDYFLVEDNGPGLPSRVLQALLDPWTHQSAVVTEDGRGGMGLLLSRKLMEVQGGRLIIESSPGKGTRIACQFSGAVRDGAQASRSIGA